MKVEQHKNLQEYNAFRLPVYADTWVEYESFDDLYNASYQYKYQPRLLMGGGTNMLFLEDFHGVVYHSVRKQIEPVWEWDDKVIVLVGSGVAWDDLVAYTVEKGWCGLENLSGIPGDVGAAAVQNIGAYGVEVKDVLNRVETFDFGLRRFLVFDDLECEYEYRKSIFKNPEKLKGQIAMLDVAFLLTKTFTPKLGYGALRNAFPEGTEVTQKMVRDYILALRDSKLPDQKVMGNAGSFFLNPVVEESVFRQLKEKHPDLPSYAAPNGVKLSAAWLIDQCGWKGKKLGGAGVYEKQPLVIVNLGNATADDIRTLSQDIQDSVKERFGVELHPEVEMVKTPEKRKYWSF